MSLITISLAICLVAGVHGGREYRFQCKPAAGCTFDHCDPVPPAFLEIEGFNADLYRQRNEYHINCKPTIELSRQMAGSRSYTDEPPKNAQIQDMIEKSVKSHFEFLSDKIKVLEDNLQMLKEKFSSIQGVTQDKNAQSTDQPQPDCRLKYLKKCYFVLKLIHKMNVTESVSACSRRNGKPANIEDRPHFKSLMHFLRAQLREDEERYWLGMKIDLKTKEVLRNDGLLAEYFDWGQEQPKAGGQQDSLGILVAMKKNSKRSGMISAWKNNKFHGVICEKSQMETE